MVFLLVILISFIIIQVKNVRQNNLYKENHIKAQADVYSTIQIVKQKKLLDEYLSNNKKEAEIKMNLAENKSTTVEFKIQDRYNHDEKFVNFQIYYPDNNGSISEGAMIYKRKNLFQEKIVDDNTIAQILDKFDNSYEKIEYQNCLIYTIDNTTYIIEKSLVDSEYEKYQADNTQAKFDEEFLKTIIPISKKADNVYINSEKITIYNDSTINGIFYDRNNLYKIDNKTNPDITINGLLVMDTPSDCNYTVNGEYLSTQQTKIKFTENITKFKTNEYELISTYFN